MRLRKITWKGRENYLDLLMAARLLSENGYRVSEAVKMHWLIERA